jgi:hypothetical protein
MFFHLKQVDEILSLNCDLRILKMNTYGVKQQSILQKIHIIKTQI